MKKFFIIAFAALLAIGCTDAQKQNISDTEVDAAITLANAGFKNIAFEEGMSLSMNRDGEAVVLVFTQDLGKNSGNIQLGGLIIENMTNEALIKYATQYPQVVTAMNEVFEYGYDIRIEYHDANKGKIIAVKITRADLEKYTQAEQVAA
jgi:hypothetical protein